MAVFKSRSRPRPRPRPKLQPRAYASSLSQPRNAEVELRKRILSHDDTKYTLVLGPWGVGKTTVVHNALALANTMAAVQVVVVQVPARTPDVLHTFLHQTGHDAARTPCYSDAVEYCTSSVPAGGPRLVIVLDMDSNCGPLDYSSACAFAKTMTCDAKAAHVILVGVPSPGIPFQHSAQSLIWVEALSPVEANSLLDAILPPASIDWPYTKPELMHRLGTRVADLVQLKTTHPVTLYTTMMLENIIHARRFLNPSPQHRAFAAVLLSGNRAHGDIANPLPDYMHRTGAHVVVYNRHMHQWEIASSTMRTALVRPSL